MLIPKFSRKTAVDIQNMSKDRRYGILLGLGLLGLLLGAWLYPRFPHADAAARYEQRLPAYLQQQERFILDFFADSVFLSYYTQPDRIRYLPDIGRQVSTLEQLQRSPASLVLWRSNRPVLIDDPHNLSLNKVLPGEQPQILVDGDRFFWSKGWSLAPEVYLRAYFPMAPKEVLGRDLGLTLLAEASSGAEAVSVEGDTVWVQSRQEIPNYRLLILLITAMLLSWLGLDHRIKRWFQDGRIRYALVVLFLSAPVLGWIGRQCLATEGGFSVFELVYERGLFGPSALAVLWSGILFLWVSGNFYRWFDHRKNRGVVSFARWRAGGIYFLCVGLLTSVAYWLRALILESDQFFNLDDSLQITPSGLIVVAAVILVLKGVFVMAYTLFDQVRTWGIPLQTRLQFMMGGIVLFLPVFYWLDLGFPLWIWGLMAFIFLVLFDLFLEGDEFSLTWLIVWIIMMATFAASLSYKYILDKDVRFMEEYARALLAPQDPLLPNSDQVRDFAKSAYFSKHYQVDSSGTGGWSFRRKSFNQRSNEAQYLGLSRLPYKGLDHLDRYDYLLLEDGKLIDNQRQVSGLDWSAFNEVAEGELWLGISNSRLNVGLKAENGRLVILQRELGSYFKPLSLFAIYFIMFLGGLLMLALVHLLGPVIPQPFYTVFQTRNSLKNRIQLSVIGIILGSSIIIGMVTVWYFKSVSEDRKERAIFQEITQKEQQLEEMLEGSYRGDSMVAVDSLIRADQPGNAPLYSLYDVNGRLVSSTVPRRFSSNWMPPAALEALRFQLLPYFLNQPIQSGNSSIIGAINGREGEIIGYLEIPYAFTDRNSQLEINNFVGSIFSLYVFFMFIAGGVAIWVANSITEPISRIGQGLRRLQLGKNVPLVWKNKDEIGLLVEEYNSALEKLEESTRQLKASEREGAWREMAKQVAHEIKNPLTPMKLSVQHLMRAYASNPDEVGPLLQRMSRTLIEQIEGLVRIANEFSNFAKMPRAELKPLELNQVLASVVDLFEQSERLSIEMKGRELPAPVMGDRDQLIRVFNNLLTNAVQAIPSDRYGTIRVSIEEEGEFWLVRVRDNGAGIPEDLQEKVFYPNFTTKSSGSGIGLAMSRNIVEQHGGVITFETEENVGTTFLVKFKKQESING